MRQVTCPALLPAWNVERRVEPDEQGLGENWALWGLG